MAGKKKLGCFGTLIMWTIGLPLTVQYYFIKGIK
jgi:hypothetical protein